MASKLQISSSPLLFSQNPTHKSHPNSLPIIKPFKLTRLAPRTVQIRVRYGSIKGTSNFPLVRCSSNGDSDGGGGGGGGGAKKNWVVPSWIPASGFSPERILKLISGATSSPICQFIDSPKNFLHVLDPRIKLVFCLILLLILRKHRGH